MENSFLKSILKSGVIFGGFFSLNFLFATGSNFFFTFLQYAAIGFIIVLSYRLPIAYRDNENNGVISFSSAFVYVMLMFFIASVISFIVKMFYFTVINQEYLLLLQSQMFDIFETMKIPFTEEFDTAFEAMFQPRVFSTYYFVINMFFGLIISLIVAAVIKKEKNIFDN